MLVGFDGKEGERGEAAVDIRQDLELGVDRREDRVGHFKRRVRQMIFYASRKILSRRVSKGLSRLECTSSGMPGKQTFAMKTATKSIFQWNDATTSTL